MGMTAGSVTVTWDSHGVLGVSGTGMANSLGIALSSTIPSTDASVFNIDTSGFTDAQKVALAKWHAFLIQSIANGVALAVVTYLQSNATAHVTSEILGRTPSPNNANTDIQSPSSPVDIPIT